MPASKLFQYSALRANKAITLHYKPHDLQRVIHNSTKRYRVVACGRRFGKTLSAAAEMLKHLIMHCDDKNTSIGLVAPTYQVCQRTLDAFITITRDCADVFQIKNSMPAVIKFNNNKIYFLSADRPDSIRGFGFSFLIIDEADYVDDDVYEKVLAPTTLDMQAPVLAISTPSRKNSWFHKLYMRGQNNDPDVDSFHFHSADNPFLDKQEIEKYKLSLPEDIFRQEFLAEWVDEGGTVFPTLVPVMKHKICKCTHGPTIMGIDLAKMNDFTVVTNLCPMCKTVRRIDRFNQLDYTVQMGFIEQLIKEDIEKDRMPELIMDGTGVGGPICDQLEQKYNIQRFIFSNDSKNKLISRLRVAIAQKEISISDILPYYDMLKEEMDNFIVMKTKTGLVSYGNGNSTAHDDMVISLALAVWGLGEYASPTILPKPDAPDMWVDIGEI
jgi:hypothetical protein